MILFILKFIFIYFFISFLMSFFKNSSFFIRTGDSGQKQSGKKQSFSDRKGKATDIIDAEYKVIQK